MKELARNLIEKANLSEEQALHVAETVRSFLEQKLPDAVKGPVLGFFSQERVEGAIHKASEVASSLTGDQAAKDGKGEEKSASKSAPSPKK